jgi:hypothetical protein
MEDKLRCCTVRHLIGDMNICPLVCGLSYIDNRGLIPIQTDMLNVLANSTNINLQPSDSMRWSPAVTATKTVGAVRVYPKVAGLAIWSEICKCYSSLPLGAVAQLFCE